MKKQQLKVTNEDRHEAPWMPSIHIFTLCTPLKLESISYGITA